VEAKATAEKWFEANKDSYPEDQKDAIIEIRTKVELGEATSEEVLRLAELKTSGSSLPTGGSTGKDAKAVEKEDAYYGIKDCRK
jgi:hypothetical protein